MTSFRGFHLLLCLSQGLSSLAGGNMICFQPSESPGSCSVHSFLRPSPALGSVHKSVLKHWGQRSLQALCMCPQPSPWCSLLSSALHHKFQPPWFRHTSEETPFRLPCGSLETASREADSAILGSACLFSSLRDHHPELPVFHCAKPIFIYFVWLSSCLRQKGNPGLCDFTVVGSRNPLGLLWITGIQGNSARVFTVY